ncbi:hypothetical protein LY632_05875 [Erythrobacter sp. SDW2]|uniref:hypothetical protein n=1 Tax=Erythrobacter sp. SDW2 TaxID=2907154 RepID=UPI001F3841A6|nr:hypothetical protein [Erythrobacter sp. SDW2]UIP07924.1 hypothetical protein LY632_05875 [Erythrobacter sp. SDW2]
MAAEKEGGVGTLIQQRLTTIITWLATFRSNRLVLLVWVLLFAPLLFVEMIPLFLGLLVARRVPGHVKWHLNRRAVMAT